LPDPSNEGTACGYGAVIVNPTGVDHPVCGSDKQPCKQLSYAIGVAGYGGDIVLIDVDNSETSYSITNTNIENKSFRIIDNPADDPLDTSIISNFASSSKALFSLKNSSVEIVRIKLVYSSPTVSEYNQPFFRTSEASTELVLRGCILLSKTDSLSSESFIENRGGSVILDGVEVTIPSVNLKPLFSYIINNTYSLFTIKNSIIENINTELPLLAVTNTGNLYVINSTFSNTAQARNSSPSVNGLIISVDLGSANVDGWTGYLEVIHLEDSLNC
jgi:hypothetical protein